jgi:hypothetical protein
MKFRGITISGLIYEFNFCVKYLLVTLGCAHSFRANMIVTIGLQTILMHPNKKRLQPEVFKRKNNGYTTVDTKSVANIFSSALSSSSPRYPIDFLACSTIMPSLHYRFRYVRHKLIK